jgi:CubicO group peptidase (beta-lactamase class C family)
MDLSALLASHVASGGVAGAAAIVGRGLDVVDVAVVGSPSLDDDRPLRRDAVFRIASITKPMVAVTVMQLVDDGVLDLAAPVEDLLPELADRRVLRAIDGPLDDTVAADRSITLEDLLSLRFGFGFSPMLPFPGSTPIQDAEAELELRTLGPPWPPVPIDNDEWMRRFGTLPLLAQPGSTWMYNTGILVAGVLAERATGGSIGEVMRDRLFGPLGMVDTGFSVPADRLPRLTAQYVPADGGLQLLDRGDASSWWSSPPAHEDSSGGLVSTLDDVWAFARMMAAGGVHDGDALVSPESFRRLTTNRLTEAQRRASTAFLGDVSGWGLGMGTPLDDLGAFGWDGGTGCSWRTQPSGETAIVLTQRAMDGPLAPQIFRDVWAVAFDGA